MAYPTVKKMLNRGPASSNRYMASFTGTTAGGGGWTDIETVKILNEYSQYFISNMTMPGSSIATGELVGDVGMGVSRKYAHSRIFNEFSMTFILESGMDVYEIFNGWINRIAPRETKGGSRSIRMEYYDSYVDSKITLKKFERDGSLSLTTEVINAFPLNISDLSLNSAAQNNLLELTINFAYETYNVFTGGLSSERQSSSSDSSNSKKGGYDDTSYGTEVSPIFGNSVSGLRSFGSGNGNVDFNPMNNKILAARDNESMQSFIRARDNKKGSGSGSKSAGETTSSKTAPNPGADPTTRNKK